MSPDIAKCWSKSVNLPEPQLPHLETGYSNNIFSQAFITGIEKNLYKALSIVPGTQEELYKGLLFIYLFFFITEHVWISSGEFLSIAISSLLVISWTLEFTHTGVMVFQSFPCFYVTSHFPPAHWFHFLRILLSYVSSKKFGLYRGILLHIHVSQFHS